MYGGNGQDKGQWPLGCETPAQTASLFTYSSYIIQMIYCRRAGPAEQRDMTAVQVVN